MAYSDREENTVFGWPSRTIPEALDAARTPEEFGSVIQGLFRVLEKAKDEEDLHDQEEK